MHFNRRKDLLQLEEGVRVGGVQLCTRGPNSAGGGARGGAVGSGLVIIHSHIMHPGTGSRMGMKSYTYSIQTLNNTYCNTN